MTDESNATDLFRASGRRNLRTGIAIGFMAAVLCYLALTLMTR